MNTNSHVPTADTYTESCEQINELQNDPNELEKLKDRGVQGLMTVQDVFVCSTVVVRELDKQLIDEMNRILANCLVSFGDFNVDNGEAVHPFLQPPAKEALKRAIDDRGQKLLVNSAYRTIAQQLILFNNQCGSLVARPGLSNHQSGLALDIEDPEGWLPFLENHGWRWFGSADRPHFDYEGDDTQDIRHTAVLAFQRLWNRYNPNDSIEEDGEFGAATEARLYKSPIEGFGVTVNSATPVSGRRILQLKAPNSPLMEGEDVRKVQEALIKANIEIKVDGIFGEMTARAIK
jgi:hypothetical protein